MSIRSNHNVAICVSCGIRLAKPHWHRGDPYCQVDYEVQMDYDRTSIIEAGYKEFHNLMKLFTS